ncbi:transcriptional repressor [Brooklawnia cerclae]|uniref:Fur family ferric uptake transcriptional regulator n=1 Tax=Brooklawnia cerclae TaxID=349934 RepID=A0ABX0SHC7_9ACTN|nr:Fur family transcriptional regulator [Brooklawnia cerclae]NIH57799.1 Fur family ferric uptake transcriptional regulator [Brooklawnia cerclae]
MPPTTLRPTRATAQKEAIRRALQAAPGFVSAQQLHQLMSEEGTPVGLATVYRQLNTLAANGQADTISVASGQLFRACKPGAHHHHLVCENCGKAVEVGPPDEDWYQAVAHEHGFTVTHHVLEIFGLCPSCSSAKQDEVHG